MKTSAVTVVEGEGRHRALPRLRDQEYLQFEIELRKNTNWSIKQIQSVTHLETSCTDPVGDMKWEADKRGMGSIRPVGGLRPVLPRLPYYNILHADTLCSHRWPQHSLETSTLTVNLVRTHQIRTVTKKSTFYNHNHKSEHRATQIQIKITFRSPFRGCTQDLLAKDKKDNNENKTGAHFT